MATTKLIAIELRDARTRNVTIRDCHDYYTNPEKTDGGRLVTAIQCDKDSAKMEFLLLQRQYELANGRSVDGPVGVNRIPKIMYVIRQSFLPNEVDPDTAHAIGLRLADKFLDGNFQCVVTTHIDQKHIHNNILFNAVGLDLKKFNFKKNSYKAVRYISDALCEEYGLSVVIPNREKRSQKYSKGKAISFRSIIQGDIDAAVRAARSYEDFLGIMAQNYIINSTGKYLSFLHRTNGQQRSVRAYSIGSAYSEEQIKLRLRTNRVPSKKIPMLFAQRVSARAKLTIEKQTNISYSQRLRNIQTMFSALHIIHENSIERYSDIQARISEVSQGADSLQSKWEEAEREIKKLQAIISAVAVCKQFQELGERYEAALLKERFYEEHRAELDALWEAQALLASQGIDYRTANTHELENAIARISPKAAELAERLDEIQAKTYELIQMRRVVDGLHKNQSILPSIREQTKRVKELTS